MFPVENNLTRAPAFVRTEFIQKIEHELQCSNAVCMRVCKCVWLLCAFFMYFVVFAERLAHFLKLDLQLVAIALAELGPAHLLGGGEGMESLIEEEVVLLIQRVRGDVRDVPTTHLVRPEAESRALCYTAHRYRNNRLQESQKVPTAG